MISVKLNDREKLMSGGHMLDTSTLKSSINNDMTNPDRTTAQTGTRPTFT